jgi:hypothetical protein
MPVPNVFNEDITGAMGDNTIVAAVTGKSIILRQINIQNKDAALETEISIKSGDLVVWGPVIVQAKQMLSLELTSEGDEPLFELEKGDALVVESSADVDLIVFGKLNGII